MRLFSTWAMLSALCTVVNGASAQLQVAPEGEPLCVFAGSTQLVPVRCQNAGTAMLESNIRMRTMQLSSTIASPLAEAPWKTLQILPRQTVVETAALAFPAVRGETHFLVQWVENSNRVAGAAEVRVYPTNLLSELQPLIGKEGVLGVFDPCNELKNSLRNAKVDFIDLENTVVENFRGTLAIIGPFDAKTEIEPITTAQIKALAGHGVGIVWATPAAEITRSGQDEIQPSFYSVPGNQTAVIVAQQCTVANLAGNPRSQLNLIYFCKLALNPHPLTLPSVKKQP